MVVVNAPEEPDDIPQKRIFLAGSIEMGIAEEWQKAVIKQLVGYPVKVFNPRRADWDSSWEQKASNPKFREQVLWELENIGNADILFFYFSPGTKSPITLLELGLVIGSGNFTDIIVVCPEGYWRKGNIDIVCEMDDLVVYNTLEEGIEKLKELLKS